MIICPNGCNNAEPIFDLGINKVICSQCRVPICELKKWDEHESTTTHTITDLATAFAVERGDELAALIEKLNAYECKITLHFVRPCAPRPPAPMHVGGGVAWERN